MPGKIQKITPNLWFDTQAEEAAEFYTSLFSDSRIVRTARYGKESYDKTAEGKVMTVEFRLEGQNFVALNGGPHFKFNEAISFIVSCDDQDEVDRYWNALSEGGDEKAQQCGWLKDRFGVSWQIVPKRLHELLGSGDADSAGRVTKAMLGMKKLDIPELERAYEG
ncbi:VOC family protein [Saccharibacillus sp. CPCC 101409]|uniref:VOC family protein n=1 Tax=Saccharibacillus sp. CPCC 101409 TaxID=3058041 RepID=UPI002673AAED|nr:VOC family protein [Saccharibacillus sp. CPCC 101409]MDO3409758.1 VOC family protein [Saccharibacillus sp. CPCC 101409]